jgi:hypothetical protein
LRVVINLAFLTNMIHVTKTYAGERIRAECSPGWILSEFRALHSAATASSLLCERPAKAHLRSVGKLVAMCSAVSFPVYPVAPKTTRSY